MNTYTHMPSSRTFKGRGWWVAVCLAAALSLIVGSSTAQAARMGSRTSLVLVSASPATPAGGQTYTMKFSLMRSGSTEHIAQIACYARANGQLARLTGQGGDGSVDYCAWSVPSSASGHTFDGMVAVKNDAGKWFYYGFDKSVS